jgi:type II secretory pathway pseudopilin PulG
MAKSAVSKEPGSAGFTIVELVVAMCVSMLIALVVIKFWINASEAFALDTNIVTIKQESARAMEAMADRISRADVALGITLSNGNTTIDFTDGVDGSAVQYTLNPLAPTAPVWGEIVQTVNGAPRTVAGYVEALQFTATGTGLVTITATFHKGRGRTETQLAVQSSVAARN